jgi:hypothetical protein
MDTVDIKVVKSQADLLGISYHHRSGAEKIAGMVAAHLAANPQDALKLIPGEPKREDEVAGPVKADDFEKITEKTPTKADGAPCPVKPMSSKEFAEIDKKKRFRESNQLKRCIIQCMNPAKREWPGETISVGSSQGGTYKKFIPFNSEPYHVPKIIYDVLKERQCTVFRTEQGKQRGQDRRVGYLINEFQIADLPPLKPAEIEELRSKQQMAKAGL